jgi:hypothetical protein
MTGATPEPSNGGQPTVEQADDASAAPALPVAPAALPTPADERPELVVGAAFAGGLALALLLKRRAR